MKIVNHVITDLNSVLDFIKQFKEDGVKYTSFDTETTGLNIVKDTPFLFIFGYLTDEDKTIKTWLIDIRDVTKEIWDSTLYAVQKLFSEARYVIGHNIKYDLHMMANIGYERMFTNISDTQIIIRLSHESLVRSEGGPPDDLKGYSVRHIDPRAATYQKRVSSELARLKRANTTKLLEILKENYEVPEEYSGRRWSMTLINEMTKDAITGMDNIPKEIADLITKYRKDVSWTEVPKEILHEYAHMDVVLPLKIFVARVPIMLEIGNEEVFKRENELIIPLYESERNGLPFNTEYAEEVQPKLKQYILKKRKRFEELAGQPITVSQHDAIKQVLRNKFKYPITSTGKDQLEQINSPNKELMEFIDIIGELRSLEKWYLTYLQGYIDNETDGRIHTSFKQSGAVTGRLSSGFQQFPRRGIRDDQGEEIFNPRRLVSVKPDGEYNRLGYIDYSQIELRVQAAYTILISGGDLNLCRAFMPFKCIKKDGTKYVNGEQFVDGEWYLEESPDTVWHPVDVHAKTAEVAFGDEIKQDPDYYRSIGKTTNFASNYGSGVGGIQMALKSTTALAEKMFKAYSEAYPGIYDYRRYVQRAIVVNRTVRNLYNRHYFGASAHKIGNYLVQGSAADIIKMKMIEVDNYIKEKGYKSRVLMNIHDEIQFELHRDEPTEILYEFKAIMEDLKFPVPIVADIEISYTSWDEACELDE